MNFDALALFMGPVRSQNLMKCLWSQAVLTVCFFYFTICFNFEGNKKELDCSFPYCFYFFFKKFSIFFVLQKKKISSNKISFTLTPSTDFFFNCCWSMHYVSEVYALKMLHQISRNRYINCYFNCRFCKRNLQFYNLYCCKNLVQ